MDIVDYVVVGVRIVLDQLFIKAFLVLLFDL